MFHEPRLAHRARRPPLAESLDLLGVEGGAHVEGERGLVAHGAGRQGWAVLQQPPTSQLLARINRRQRPAGCAGSWRGTAHARPATLIEAGGR